MMILFLNSFKKYIGETKFEFQLPPIDSNFNDNIFNTDESGDEEETGSGIYNNSFSLASLASPLGNEYSPRVTTPDPLSLNLPSLSFSTPQHEFSRQFSLSQESPSDYEKFTDVMGVGSHRGGLPQFLSPPRTDIDDLDLRDLLSTKSLPPASPAPRTRLNIENLLEIDPRSSADQLQDIIETVVNAKPPTPPSITEVPNSPAPLDPRSVLSNPETSCQRLSSPKLCSVRLMSPRSSQTSTTTASSHKRLKSASPRPISPTSLSHITKSATSVPFSSENCSKIVDRLDDLISSNESRVQLSAIPKSSEPPVVTKRQKPNKKHNFVRPDPRKVRPISKKVELANPSERPIDPRLIPRKSSMGEKSTLQPTSPSSTLATLASSLGIVKPASPHKSTQSCALHNAAQAVNSASMRPAKLGSDMSQPIVIGKSNTQSKPSQRYLNKPVIISQIPPQAVIKSKPIVKATKIVSTSVKSYPNTSSMKTCINVGNTKAPSAITIKTSPNGTNKQSIVPYKTPAQTPNTENNKYVLLPLEKLKNASPAVIAQLGLDKTLANSAKRPVSGDPGPEKRMKADSPEPGTSFTDRTTFPINIKLPKSTKERLSSEYHGSIPEMIEKARAKRKSNLSNMSTFTQMESFINEFIQQNNDQVMEILFLKKNNKEINSKFNQLAKLFHMKNQEHKKLKEEVREISSQNKKMEKELKMIKDVVKKYMTS